MSGSLAFACIAPHGSLAIPLVSGADGLKASITRTGMAELSRRMAAIQPETVVLITPHGTFVDGVISLLHSQLVVGELGSEVGGDPGGNRFRLEFEVDTAFNDALAAEGKSRDVPVARVAFGVQENAAFKLRLDVGSLVPLWFMGANLVPKPRVVIACAGPGLSRDALPSSGYTREVYLRFGQAVRAAAERSGRRIAYIASSDLGHAHDANSRYGYDPVAAEFDTLVQEAVQANDLGRLLAVNPDWLKRAKTDAFVQLLTLHGAVSGTALKPEFLGYEHPTYYGMLCAAYQDGPL